MKILKAIALIGVIIGGVMLIWQDKTEAGVALLIIGVEEAWRNGQKS